MNRKVVSTILIVVGIAVICIPIGGRLYTKYQQDKAYAEYLEMMEQEMSAINDTLDLGIDSSEGAIAIEDPEGVLTGQAVKKASKIEGIIGRIKIPAISSDLILLEGSYNKQLNWGAGHVIGTSMPGGAGNCAIAAHRNSTFGSYFSRLGEVNIGNEIVVTYKDSTYKYIVNDIFTITPDETWVLGTDGSAIITLITCHPKGSNAQRLIVRGVLSTGTKPEAAAKIEQEDGSIEELPVRPEAEQEITIEKEDTSKPL